MYLLSHYTEEDEVKHTQRILSLLYYSVERDTAIRDIKRQSNNDTPKDIMKN